MHKYFLFLALPFIASAQQPDLSRDLSGIWLQKEPGASFSKAAPPKMTAWAEARFLQNRPTIGPFAALDANDSTVVCFPPGVPYILAVPVPFEFIQTKGRVIQLFEYNHNVRQIFTDGRPHPADLKESEIAQWMGHSIGRWEGNVFVIDTIGFNDRSWLDRLGHPHSTSLHVTERIRRVDRETLEYNVVVDDPEAYTALWRGQIIYALRTGWDILEHNCMPEGEDYMRYKERAWKNQ